MNDDGKSTGVGYALWLANIVGVAGLHRFYLGKPVTGVLYLMTWGLLGIGSFIDLFLIPGMVQDENRKRLAGQTVHLHLHGAGYDGVTVPRQLQAPGQALPLTRTDTAENAERQILRLAAARAGVVTPQIVALETDMTLADAKRELEALVEAGYCSVDVGEDGAEQYHVSGLSVTKPLLE